MGCSSTLVVGKGIWDELEIYARHRLVGFLTFDRPIDNSLIDLFFLLLNRGQLGIHHVYHESRFVCARIHRFLWSDKFSSDIAFCTLMTDPRFYFHLTGRNDFDILEVGNGGMTFEEYKSHFTSTPVFFAIPRGEFGSNTYFLHPHSLGAHQVSSSTWYRFIEIISSAASSCYQPCDPRDQSRLAIWSRVLIPLPCLRE